MSKVDLILSRLDKVRKGVHNSWLACCPAHEDRSPSLAIREADDGKVLLRCFAGCGADEVLAAIGLEFDALFPDRPDTHHHKPERRPFPAADVLRTLAFEVLVAYTVAKDTLTGKVTEEDTNRLALAVTRIGASLPYCGVTL